MKKHDRHRGSESSRIKNIQKKINLKCMEMREKMKQQKNSTLLQDDEIESRVLIFRQMLLVKEDVPEEGALSKPSEKANDAKKSKMLKKSKKIKGEKLDVAIDGQKMSDHVNSSKRKGTKNDLSSRTSTPQVPTSNGSLISSSNRTKQSQKPCANPKTSSVRSHSSIVTENATKDPLSHRKASAYDTVEVLTEHHHRNSRSISVERRKSRSYSLSMSPYERIRDRSSDRHSSNRRSEHSRDRSLSRSLSRSRSPSIRRRKGSPSHLDRRRITRS